MVWSSLKYTDNTMIINFQMTQIWLKYYDLKWLIIINKSQHMSQTFQVMSHQYDSCLSIVISATSTSNFGFDWFQIEFTEIRKGTFPCEILKKGISHKFLFICYDVIIFHPLLWRHNLKGLIKIVGKRFADRSPN